MGKSFAIALYKDKALAGDLKLPEALAHRFDVVECMADNERAVTVLLSEKESGRRYVLKYAESASAAGINGEASLLSNLSHKGIPKYEASMDAGGMAYSLREYCDGMTLAQYIEEYGPLDTARALRIASALCDILIYLHDRATPIIHRDIKPANIIINPDDMSVKLIDFDISREYSKGSDTDTTYFGTKRFSPPEQYGYAQTDGRTDIYAMGVVLRVMLTGSADGSVANAEIAHIAAKCTAFDPKRRYQTAAALRAALIWAAVSARFHVRKVQFIALCAALFVAGWICGVQLMPRQAELPSGTDTYQELARAVYYGFGEYNSSNPSVSYAVFMEMLDKTVELADKGKLAQWRARLTDARKSRTLMTRYDAMIAILYAAETLGGDYWDFNADWWAVNMAIGEDEFWTGVRWNENLLDTDYQISTTFPSQPDVINYPFKSLASFYSMGRKSLVSDKLLFDYDAEAKTLHQDKDLKYTDAMLAALRLYESSPR